MKYVIDAARLTTKEESHAYLKELFAFPEYYGGNLDALRDCLDEIGELEIKWANEGAHGSYYSRVKKVIDQIK